MYNREVSFHIREMGVATYRWEKLHSDDHLMIKGCKININKYSYIVS